MPNSTTPSEYFKSCTSCGRTLPATLEYFRANKIGKYGIRSQCRECERECDRERARKWRVENPEKRRESQRKYAAANPEKVRESARKSGLKWRVANREEKLERDRQYRQGNRDRLSEYARQYYQENREQARVKKHHRRSRQLAAPGSHTAAELREQLKRQKSCCYYCGCSIKERANRHIEHVVPLSRGGSNDIGNIVLACKTCNLRKHDKLPHEWIDGGRLL